MLPRLRTRGSLTTRPSIPTEWCLATRCTQNCTAADLSKHFAVCKMSYNRFYLISNRFLPSSGDIPWRFLPTLAWILCLYAQIWKWWLFSLSHDPCYCEGFHKITTCQKIILCKVNLLAFLTLHSNDSYNRLFKLVHCWHLWLLEGINRRRENIGQPIFVQELKGSFLKKIWYYLKTWALSFVENYC